MCKQFFATAVHRLDGPVLDLIPAGTIVCQDAKGDWYRNVSGLDDGLDLDTLRDIYYARMTKGTKLYRDYWRHCPWSPDSVAGRTLVNVAKTKLSH